MQKVDSLDGRKIVYKKKGRSSSKKRCPANKTTQPTKREKNEHVQIQITVNDATERKENSPYRGNKVIPW